jgi:hypothetical protein
VYKDENNTVRIVQGIRKPVSVQKISAMQFTKCINKGCKVYVFQVTNLLGEERKPSLKDFAGLRGFRDLNVRQERWLVFLSEFNFDVRHIKGKENKVAYALSQRISEIYEIIINKEENEIEQRIKSGRSNDENYI